MPAEKLRRWSAREVRALMDESRPAPRYEVIDGELLVTPAPSIAHQRAVALFWQALHGYLSHERIGEAFMSPADLELEKENVTQPDVFVVPIREGERPMAWADITVLLLAAEVLSPSNARQDRVTKRKYFQRNRVSEYWIVDLDARVVKRWTPHDGRPEILDHVLIWQPEGASEPLSLDLPPLFAGVH